jgi:hypothetical protein
MHCEYILFKKNVINEVDKAIIDETNKLLEELEKDMIILRDITLIINEKAVEHGEVLNKVEKNVVEADNNISEAVPILEDTVHDKYEIIKMVGGGIIGGLVGAGGFALGIIPGFIGVGLGAGGGVGAVCAVEKFGDEMKEKIKNTFK